MRLHHAEKVGPKSEMKWRKALRDACADGSRGGLQLGKVTWLVARPGARDRYRNLDVDNVLRYPDLLVVGYGGDGTDSI